MISGEETQIFPKGVAAVLSGVSPSIPTPQILLGRHQGEDPRGKQFAGLPPHRPQPPRRHRKATITEAKPHSQQQPRSGGHPQHPPLHQPPRADGT